MYGYGLYEVGKRRYDCTFLLAEAKEQPDLSANAKVYDVEPVPVAAAAAERTWNMEDGSRPANTACLDAAHAIDYTTYIEWN